MKLLQIDFKYNGPFGDEMSGAFIDLAQSINNEKGFVSKIWTENKETNEAGGIYIFTDEESALAYLQMHTKRLNGFGIEHINAKIFDVNVPLSLLNNIKL